MDTLLNWNLANFCGQGLPYKYFIRHNEDSVFSRQELLSIVDRFLPNIPFLVRFAGGDPTLQPHLPELVKKLCKKNTKIILVTDFKRNPAYFQHLLADLPEKSVEIHAVLDVANLPSKIRETLVVILNAKQYCRITLLGSQQEIKPCQALYTAFKQIQKKLPFALDDSVYDRSCSSAKWLDVPSKNHKWFTADSFWEIVYGLDVSNLSWISSKTLQTENEEQAIVAQEMESVAIGNATMLLPTRLRYLAGDSLGNDPVLALRRTGLFDEKWYIEHNPDVVDSHINPVQHYVNTGTAEGRDPVEWFSTKWYLKQYPDIAVAQINPFYHYIFTGYSEQRLPHEPNSKSKALVKQAEKLKKGKNFADAAEYYAQAREKAEISDSLFGWTLEEGHCLMEIKKYVEAEALFREAHRLSPKNAEILAILGDCLKSQWKWWQEIEIYKQALSLNPKKEFWWAELAKACDNMDRWDEAVDAYEHAIAIDAQWWEWSYRLGCVYEKNGQHDLAQEAFAKAIKCKNPWNAEKFGVGVFHVWRAWWPEAAKAYEALAKKNPNDAEIQAKLAIAYHRCYEFEKATFANLNILSLTQPVLEKDLPLRLDALYRLGIVSERLGDLENAAMAYQAVVDAKYDTYRCYRCGYVLAQMGKHEDACAMYLRLGQSLDSQIVLFAKRQEEIAQQSENLTTSDENTSIPGEFVPQHMAKITADRYRKFLAEDGTDPALHFQLGVWAEKAGDSEGAVAAYAASAARQSDHNPAVWYSLGRALHSCGHFVEVCEAFANIEILRQPYWVDRKFYTNNIWFQRRANYLEYCEHLSIAEKTVFYESMHGIGVSDNPRAIFLAMLDDPRYAGWTHIWSLENLANIPEELKSLPNVIFVRRESDGFLRYLATAKILINNVTFPDYFVRRPEQIHLNTWHGTPMKALGKDVKDNPIGYGNVTRNFLHCTHLIHPNKFTEDVLLDSYNIRDLFQGISFVTGYPRVAHSLSLSKEEKKKLRQKLHIPAGKKIILYAPTWRGANISEKGVNKDVDFIKDVLDVCCQQQDYVVLLREHQAFERYGKVDFNVLLAPQSFDANEILAISDVLITDYSSIAFDFMIFKRPILFYCHDFEDYATTRGFYITPKELVGSFCTNPQELQTALADLETWKPNDQYKAALKKFCSYDDGKATQRVLDVLSLPLSSKPQHSEKKNLLFYINLVKNGIGVSFLALSNALAEQKNYNIYVLINTDFVKNNPESLDMIAKLHPDCKVIPSIRVMNLTIEERRILENYNAQKRLFNDPDYSILKKIYTREWHHLFKNVQFYAVIDFDGYVSYQTEFFAFMQIPCKKIVYLHNDMLSEKNTRFSYLSRTFNAYPLYDKVVSVSKSLCQVNKENLAVQYGIPEEKLVTCLNVQRPEYIRKVAQEELLQEDVAYFDQDHKVFVNIARPSPEKNQKMLIEAFALVHAKYPKTRLLILGKGPLEDDLREIIAQLELTDCAFVLGLRDNPYSLLKHSDCFVFPSLYEGQGLVLFEAMALKKPIVATAIPTSCEVLENGKYGKLTDNTPEAFAEGMEAFLRGEIPIPDFDFTAYNKEALRQFESLIEDDAHKENISNGEEN